jgi:hypothetical protein
MEFSNVANLGTGGLPGLHLSIKSIQITSEGMIVDETIVRQKVAQKDLKEHTDAMLARAVVAKTVEMEVSNVPMYLPLFDVHVNFTETAESRDKTKARIFGEA